SSAAAQRPWSPTSGTRPCRRQLYEAVRRPRPALQGRDRAVADPGARTPRLPAGRTRPGIASPSLAEALEDLGVPLDDAGEHGAHLGLALGDEVHDSLARDRLLAAPSGVGHPLKSFGFLVVQPEVHSHAIDGTAVVPQVQVLSAISTVPVRAAGSKVPVGVRPCLPPPADPYRRPNAATDRAAAVEGLRLRP